MYELIFLLSLLCFGGFYVWSKCFGGVLMAIALLLFFLEGKKKMKRVPITANVLLLCVVMSTIWAVDRSRQFEGILYAVVGFAWLLACCAMENKQKERLLGLIPILGALMTFAGVAIAFVPQSPIQLWQAERFGGFFQYSNTCALYLLLGLMIEAQMKRAKRYWHVGIIISLVAGIMLTGSRSIQLLLILWAIYKAFREKTMRKPILMAGCITVSVAILAIVFTGNFQNVGRLFSLASSNSTLWGRLLYLIDGVRMLLHAPMGFGYMGYSYVQGEWQTGVYQTLFVHNDFLQLGLDYGVWTMLLAGAFVILQLFGGKQSVLEKELLSTIIIAGLVDFHMQYLCILIIFILCLDMECDFKFYEVLRSKILAKPSDKIKASDKATVNGKIKASSKTTANGKLKASNKAKASKDATLSILGSMVFLIVCGYYLIAFSLLEGENDVAAGKMLGNHTLILERQLEAAEDAEKALEIAGKLVKNNSHHAKAWHYMTFAYAQIKDYENCISSMERAITYDCFNAEKYEAYFGLLDSMKEQSEISDNENLEAASMVAASMLEKKLEETQAKTSSIAWKLKDQPVLTVR